MTDTPFIAAGWLGTTAVLLLYALSISLRTRRAVRARALRSGRPQ